MIIVISYYVISKEKGLHIQTPEFLCVLAKGTTFAKHTSPRHNDFPKTGTTLSDACIATLSVFSVVPNFFSMFY